MLVKLTLTKRDLNAIQMALRSEIETNMDNYTHGTADRSVLISLLQAEEAVEDAISDADVQAT